MQARVGSPHARLTGVVIGVVVFLVIHEFLPAIGSASFEIEPVTPAERGAATGLALGLVEESLLTPIWSSHGFAGHGAIAFYNFKPFCVRDVDFGAIWATICFREGAHELGLSYQRLQVLSYVEETYLISQGLAFRNLWCRPVLRLGTIKFEGKCLDWMVLVDLTIRARISEGMYLFAGIKNPFTLELVKSRDACPTSITLGFSRLVSKRLGWGAEIQKEAGHPTSVATGMEWSLAGRLVLRAGLKTYPREFGLGVGLRAGGGMIDISTSVNLDLGATHEFGGAYIWD